MTYYDYDRWSDSLCRRSRNHLKAPSLTLHLHRAHLRLEHQNGVFTYDSPIRGLLVSIQNGRLPNELLDLLDAVEVRYFEGCLIVEVQDHRDEKDDILTGISAASAGIPTIGGDEGSNVNAIDGSSLEGAAANGLLDGIPSKKRDNAGNLKGTSEATAASLFNKRFVLSYKRFEQARLEAATIRTRHVQQQQQQQAASAQQSSQGGSTDVSVGGSQSAINGVDKGPATLDTPSNSLSGVPPSSIHSAVAAAVASATATTTLTSPDQQAKVHTYRIVLGPDEETIWTDLSTFKYNPPLAQGKRKQYLQLTDEDLVRMEAKVLELTAPPLCLSPSFEVSRIANALLAETALPSMRAPIVKPLQKKKKALPPATTNGVSMEEVGSADAVESQSGGGDEAAVPSREDIRAKRRKALQEKKEQAERRRAKLEEEEAQALALREKKEEEAWLQVMDESVGRVFQPSFSRIAFLQDWRDKDLAAKAAASNGLSSSTDTPSANGASDAVAPSTKKSKAAASESSKQASVSGSRAGTPASMQVPPPSRSGSVADISVLEEQISNTLGASTSSKDTANAKQPVPIAVAPAAAGATVTTTTKKKKANAKAAANAGSPPPPASGASGIKLTLPGKKGSTASNASSSIKVPQPGEPVPIASASASTTGKPGKAGAGKAKSPAAAGELPGPTAAQQAIMRKTANLPKAKLKSNVKAEAAANAAAAAAAAQAAAQGGAGVQPIQPAPPQAVNQIQAQLRAPANTPDYSPAAAHSQIPGQQQQQGQIFPQQGQGQPAMSYAAQQAYISQLQAAAAGGGIGRPGSVNSNGGGQGSSPFQSQMQLPGGVHSSPAQQNMAYAGQQQQQYGAALGNIHRSPAHQPAQIPGQQQGYNAYTPSNNGSNGGQMNNVSPQQQPGSQGVAGFPQHQLQALQQQMQQQQYMQQHQQALQNHLSSFNGNNSNAQGGQQQMMQNGSAQGYANNGNNPNLANLNLQNLQALIAAAGNGNGAPAGQPMQNGNAGNNAAGNLQNLQAVQNVMNQLRQQQQQQQQMGIQGGGYPQSQQGQQQWQG